MISETSTCHEVCDPFLETLLSYFPQSANTHLSDEPYLVPVLLGIAWWVTTLRALSGLKILAPIILLPVQASDLGVLKGSSRVDGVPAGSEVKVW